MRLASRINKPHLPPRSWKGWKPAAVPPMPRGIFVAAPLVSGRQLSTSQPISGGGRQGLSGLLEDETQHLHFLPRVTLPLHPQSTSVKVSNTLQKVTRQRSLTANGSTMYREPKKIVKKTVTICERPLDLLLGKFANMEERSRSGWLSAARPESAIPFLPEVVAAPPPLSVAVPETPRAGVRMARKSRLSSGDTSHLKPRISLPASKSRELALGLAQEAAASGPGRGRALMSMTTKSGLALVSQSTVWEMVAPGREGTASRPADEREGLRPAAAAATSTWDPSRAPANLAHRFRTSPTPTQTHEPGHSPPPPAFSDGGGGDAESEIDEDEADASMPHRAYLESAFALRIPVSAAVWRQLYNPSIELRHCQLGSRGVQPSIQKPQTLNPKP